MKLTDLQIRKNAPVPLFEVGGREYSTPLRSINDTDEWLEMAHTVAECEADIARAGSDVVARRAALTAFNKQVYACVFAYNPTALPAEELEKSVTPAQMVDAFNTLLELSDPFEMMQVRKSAKLQEALKGLPDSVVAKALSGLERPAS